MYEYETEPTQAETAELETVTAWLGRTPLPAHLVPYWGRRTDDPRESPAYCERQSRKTPAIPWHNGSRQCLSCGSDRALGAVAGGLS